MQRKWGFKWILLFVLLFINSRVSLGQVTINEVLVRNNGSLFDEDNACNAYVELYNAFPFSIDLHDFYLSDQSSVLDKWRFPHQTIDAHGFIVVQLSNKNRDTPLLHANFSLSIGENIYLIERNTTIYYLTDSLSHIDYRYNTTIQRFPDGGSTIQYGIPTPNSTNNMGEAVGPNRPVATITNGVHPIGTTFNLTANFSVRVTTNGSDVALSSQLNSGQVTVTSTAGLSNVFSTIPTNPSLNFPLGDYTESRANNRGWVPTYQEVPKILVLRAKSVGSSGLYSDELALTIFQDTPHFQLPVISLITDSIGFFDQENGIYVYGNDPNGNYNQESRTTERYTIIQFFDSLGVFQRESRLGMRIHGNGSRHSTQKSLRLYQRSDYDNAPLILPNGEPAKIAVLRANGHRPDCISRDVLAHRFAQNLPFAKADPTIVVVYLNGEFWGIHDIRAVLNEDFLSSEYHLPPHELAIAEFDYSIGSNNRLDTLEFQDLTLFAENNSLTAPNNYQYLADHLDIKTFTDLNCTQLFLGNADYPINNNGWFNVEYDQVTSKWRNHFFDLDGIFGGACDTVYRSFNALNFYLQDQTITWQKSTRLLRNLIENESFVADFSSRMADLLNSEFKTEVLSQKMQEYQTQISEARLPHVTRWRYPSYAQTLIERYSEVPTLGKWDEIFDGMEVFIRKRQATTFRHFMNQFGFSDTAHLQVFADGDEMGYVQVNSLLISTELAGVSANPYPWSGTYFQDIPVHLAAASKPGYRFVNWNNQPALSSEQLDVMLISDTIMSAIFAIDPGYFEPHINEILLQNTMGELDEFGQHEGWIEWFNPNSYSISVAGYFLTDELSNKTKFRMKADESSILEPNEYQLLYTSGAPKRGSNHLSFTIPNAGETIYLIAPDSTTILQSIPLPILDPNQSFGSSPNGSLSYSVFYQPTPRQNNNLSNISTLFLTNENGFQMAPNPTNSWVQFSIEDHYAVFTISGALIIPPTKTNFLRIDQLEAGLYLVRNSHGVSQRLVKF